MRQVHIWLRDDGIELPVKAHNTEAEGVVWRLPAYNTVHNILTNPIYAGTYAFGRTTSKVSVENGRKRVRRGVRRPINECDVLIKDHHEGYISWDEFERNQRVIAHNAVSKGSAMVKGAVRKGEVLLAGLLRCGHCGRKLHVHYSSNIGRYTCYGARVNHGTERCISIGSIKVDAAVSTEVLRIVKPLGIDAAVKAIEAQSCETTAAQRQHELALQQARYEAAHARRQYDAVDPTNRLVAKELERRWNVALENVQGIEREMAASAALRSPPLDEQQKQQLMALGADLARAWSHFAATAATRKRILRACLDEIIVRKDGEGLDMVLRWHGGDHTALKLRVKLNASGRSYNPVTDDLIAIVHELARLMPDRQIARLLNRSGTQMASGKAWTEQSVHGFRKHRDIAPYRDGEWAERAEITLEAAAKIIGVCNMTALRMLRRGDIKGRQVCPGAPWVIKAADLAAFTGRHSPSRPLTPNGTQRAFDFQ